MKSRSLFLIGLIAVMSLSVPALGRSTVEKHPYFWALVAGEHCAGHYTTVADELRLAQAIRLDTGKDVTTEEVRTALKAYRYRPNPTVCRLARYQDHLKIYRRAVLPYLQQRLTESEDVG